MQCPKCQFENPEEMQFCGRCGSKLQNICPSCEFANLPEFQFCGKCGARLTPESSPSDAVPKLEEMHAQLRSLIPDVLAQKYLTAEHGENRLITALFADISGFTQLSAVQSSETIFQMVQDCFKQLVSIVASYEGNISGFRGDGLLALFGAPILHENDAERALLAAIDMRNAIQTQQLEVSIGVNTALMTVGEINTQLHKEYTAYGTDINLAKRLQEASEPGQILVGRGCYRITQRAFDFETLHALNLRNFPQPVTAYAVQQVKTHPEKLRGIEGLRARMIGREREFADLKETTDQWLAEQGQIVSVIGEAGIGKSRLVTELKAYLSSLTGGAEVPDVSQSWTWLEGRCISIGQPISYWLFLDILRTYFNFSEEDSEREMARKVTEGVTNLLPQSTEEILPFFGHLLSIRFGNEFDRKLEFATPDQIKHQTLMRLRDFFETLAKQRPLLLILEDLHWADDLSLDLISLLMDELTTTPLMLLCVYRPEKEHRVWQLSNQAQRKCLDRYAEITLKKLSSRESRQLVETLLTIDNLPESVKEMILQKSEGNPFFIEEVIRSLIEQDLVYREGDRWKAREEIADIDVPDTIQSVVLARVDRLQAEAKYVLQSASVIGRLFKYRLLEHLTQQEQNIDRYLSEFEERELVYEERTVPELEYAFKHALTQEATYQGILERRRREFHHQVAAGIERLYQERLEEYYEELAHHYSKSGDAEKAVEYLLKAGEKAKRSYANEAAIAYFNEALEMLEQGGMERNDWKLEALRGLGEVYLGIGKIVEAEKAFEGAIALAKEIGFPPHQLVRLYGWISEALWWQSRLDEVICYGEAGLDILGDDTECLEAALMNTLIGIANLNKGNVEKFREYTHRNMAFIKKLDYSVELTAPYEHIIIAVSGDLEAAWEWTKELETRAGERHDLRGLAAAWMRQGEYTLIRKGDYKNGLSSYQKSLDMFQRIGDDKNVSMCHSYIAGTLFYSGNIEEAEAHARVSLRMAEQVGQTMYIAGAHSRLGAIALCQRRWEEAIFHYQKSLEGRQSIGNPFWITWAHLLLGRAYLKKGDCHQAIQSFEEAADGAIVLPDETRQVSLLSNAIGGLEETHAALGTCRGGASVPTQFVEFCRSFKERHADVVEKLSLYQWYLESAEPSKEFSNLAFADDFDTPAATQSKDFWTETIDPSWSWMDEFGDCACKIVDAGRLGICAANGRSLGGLNLSAPRLMREISGDFAVEVCVSSASDEKPQMGGLLVWKDRDNFLRFEIGVHGQHEVRLHGYVGGKYQVAGRGLLSSGRDKEIYLRLERTGEQFPAYCSVECGSTLPQNWLTCGKLTLPLNDPIQIGIHDIGMIDRTIYCGSFKDGTTTLFRRFRLWTK